MIALQNIINWMTLKKIIIILCKAFCNLFLKKCYIIEGIIIIIISDCVISVLNCYNFTRHFGANSSCNNQGFFFENGSHGWMGLFNNWDISNSAHWALAIAVAVFDQTPIETRRNYSAKSKLLVYLILYGWESGVDCRAPGIVNVFLYTDACLSLTFWIHCAHLWL